MLNMSCCQLGGSGVSHKYYCYVTRAQIQKWIVNILTGGSSQCIGREQVSHRDKNDEAEKRNGTY